jgi:hypothetical protein
MCLGVGSCGVGTAIARVEALGVRQLLGAFTTLWVLVGASPTGPTSNGQPDVEDFEGGEKGEELNEPSDLGEILACHYHYRSARGSKQNPPWYRPGNRR